MIQILPHVNASLNALATILLIVGWTLVRRGRVDAHRKVMLACFGVSVVFLASYVAYHVGKGGVSTPFPQYPSVAVRYFYYAILLSHVLLAAAVPVLAIASIYLGLKRRAESHRRVSKWTWPIWLYVSVTGVVVYLMLYQVFPPQATS